MLIDEYFQQIDAIIALCPIIVKTDLIKDKRSPYIGFLEGHLSFLDGSSLHAVEFVNVKTIVDRYKYSYHYQDANNQLIFRYDMAPHHPDVATFPHHKHVGAAANAQEASAPTLEDVLREIESLLIV